jgi:hypothetical protein
MLTFNSQLTRSESESEAELLYDWWFTANQFILATSPLALTASDFILQLNTCGYSPYVTSSLTRGWVCHLQLLLVLASAVILRSEPHGTHDHTLPFQIQDPPTWRARSSYLYPLGTRWPDIPPGTAFSFRCLLFLLGCMEILDSASTRDSLTESPPVVFL